MSRTRALSPHARTVLAVLLDAGGQWSHGYELARLADVKSGTLYPLLIRLEAQGYLEAEWHWEVPPKDAEGVIDGTGDEVKDTLTAQSAAETAFND